MRALASLMVLGPLAFVAANAEAANQSVTVVQPNLQGTELPPSTTTTTTTTTTESTSTSATQRDLEASEREDSGQGLEWFWLNAEAGVSYLNLSSLSEQDLGLKRSSATGPMFGFGAGVRLLFLTLGARARHHALSDMAFWEVDGEVGVHVKVGRVDPYIAFRGGYAFSGDLSAVNNQSATVRGFNIGLAVGGDYYFSSLVSVGGELSGDFLFLRRPPIPLPPGLSDADKAAIEKQPLYQATGTSAGFGVVGSAHLGIHF